MATFVLFLLIGLGLGAPLFQFITLGSFIEKHFEGMARISAILNAPALPGPPGAPIQADQNSLVAQGVTFAYGMTSVIKGIDFSLPEKSFTALVGPSGAGKTTLARLIPRFWDVNDGSLGLGNTDIRHMKLEDLMDRITFVFQDIFLFNDTIHENLRMGKPDATLAKIESAARAAGCHDFITRLPKGYQSVVGERGTRISGGEKQRISIARALLKNSPILVLDEATAFIDPENEALIQEAINTLVKDKTLIVIAHRLSTITGADQILVIDDGKIVARGNHEALLQESDLYNNMWNAHVDHNWQLS
jgi:ATP-binding cassette subfamily B protein